MPPLLDASGLACRRGGRLVFQDLHFALQAGDALVVTGPNGSGKSSLLRVLAGFLDVAAGKLRWAGADLATEWAAHRARVHYVGHAHGLKTALSARENLTFAAALAGGAARVDAALEVLDLAALADVPTRLFSAGQRRRLALARLVAAARTLWLLDEPGVGLDAASRSRLEALIDRHRGDGGVVVLATHGDVETGDPLRLDLG